MEEYDPSAERRSRIQHRVVPNYNKNVEKHQQVFLPLNFEIDYSLKDNIFF